jgi:1,4-dihydroxy-2-naphthoate octaprenyltransferase
MSLTVWIEAARPRTLAAAVAPVVIGLSLAYEYGHSIELGPAVACLVMSLLIQIGTNYCNDYFDFINGKDTSIRKGPQRATQAGLVAPKQMRQAMWLMFGGALIVGGYLGSVAGWPLLALSACSTVAGYMYTGGPAPLSYLGLGDLFVLVFFGPVAVGGTFFAQQGALPSYVILAGIAPGLLATAILAVNNVRDIDEDRITGKRTLPVRFGLRLGQVEYGLCVAGAMLIPCVLVSIGFHPLILFSLMSLPLAAPHFLSVWKADDAGRLNAALGGTGKVLLAYSLLFAAGAIL